MLKKRYIWMILSITWTLVIIIYTLQPGNTSSNLSSSILERILAWFAPDILNHPTQLNILHNILRKGAHFAEYFVLGTLTICTVHYMKIKYKKLNAIAYCGLIATIDEMIQLFVPGRSGKLVDVMVDCLGAIVAIVFINKLRKKCIQ